MLTRRVLHLLAIFIPSFPNDMFYVEVHVVKLIVYSDINYGNNLTVNNLLD